MNSFNHYAYGAVGEWLYRVALGVEIDEKAPGYRHIIISPQTSEKLDYAKGSYESVYGPIKVSWEKGKEAGERKLCLAIPHNTTASICLEKGAREASAEGLVFHEEKGRLTAHCGSGEWEIWYKKNSGAGISAKSK